MNSLSHINRGFNQDDMRDIYRSDIYRDLRVLLDDLTEKKCAVSSRGTLKATNLNDTSGRHLRHTLHYMRAWEYVRVISVLGLANASAKQRIICLGEGSTLLVFYLAQQGHSVTVIDCQEELILNTQTVAKIMDVSIDARIGDMTALTDKDKSYDVALSCSVIEHLTDEHKRTAMREMGRVLKVSGRIGLTFDYGDYCGTPLTGEAHQTIAGSAIETLLVAPSGCRLYSPLDKSAQTPWVLKQPWWPYLPYCPPRVMIARSFFYRPLPYSYYTLFLEKSEAR